MGRPLFLIIAAALVLVAHIPILGRGSPADSPRSGTSSTQIRAPQFLLTDLSGNKLDLASYRGKVVLLNFWATWCAPCRAEVPRLVDLQKKYDERGLRIIGISLDDDAKAVRMFYRQFKMNYPVAIGDAALAERYGGILGLPVTFLIGCDGKIYAKHTGEVGVSIIEQKIKLLLDRDGCTQRNYAD